jgi:hypothetical protein
LVCALPGIAAGAAEFKAESKRWLPALAVFGEVLAQQPEETQETAADLSPSGDDLRVLALVSASDGVIALLVPEEEPGHWVAEIAVPGEEPVQRAAGAEQSPILPAVYDRIPVATPVVVATAEPVMPAASPDADEVVEPITPVEVGATGPAPEAAVPERKAKDETERWVPAFSFYSGVLVQKAKGTVDTSDLAGPCVEPIPAAQEPLCVGPVRPSASGDDLMVTPFVAGSLELMTPGLTSVPGRPRLFAHADAAASFGFTRDVAKEGLPGEFELAPGDPPPITREETIRGQGSTTTVEVKPLLISAGAGVAFTVDAWERRLRIKPSVEYLREEIAVSGVVNRAVQIRSDADQKNVVFPDDFRLIELRGSEKRVFHGVGPGLELELDTARAGPLMLAVYVAGQAYAFLGDLEIEFSDTNEYEEAATWSAEKNRWGFRAGVGLRFRWVPE